MGRTSYDRRLNKHNRIYVQFITHHGKITNFVIQYETFVGSEWKQVIRFDNSHGSVPHRHLFNLRGDDYRIELRGKNEEIFTNSLEYIKYNYQKIRNNFLYKK
jgi:hypothetical protein